MSPEDRIVLRAMLGMLQQAVAPGDDINVFRLLWERNHKDVERETSEGKLLLRLGKIFMFVLEESKTIQNCLNEMNRRETQETSDAQQKAILAVLFKSPEEYAKAAIAMARGQAIAEARERDEKESGE